MGNCKNVLHSSMKHGRINICILVTLVCKLIMKRRGIMLVSMKEILERANQGNYAVPAPNVVTELDARAALEVAEELCSPMVLDVSFRANPDMEFLGGFLKQLADKAKIPVALHMDHGAEYEKFAQCILAIRSGFTSLMVDRSTLPFEENVRQVKEIVKIAHAVGARGLGNHFGECVLGSLVWTCAFGNRSSLYTDPENSGAGRRSSGYYGGFIKYCHSNYFHLHGRAGASNRHRRYRASDFIFFRSTEGSGSVLFYWLCGVRGVSKSGKLCTVPCIFC